MDPRDGLHVVEKSKISIPTGIRTPDRPSCSPVVTPNTLLRLVLLVHTEVYNTYLRKKRGSFFVCVSPIGVLLGARDCKLVSFVLWSDPEF